MAGFLTYMNVNSEMSPSFVFYSAFRRWWQRPTTDDARWMQRNVKQMPEKCERFSNLFRIIYWDVAQTALTHNLWAEFMCQANPFEVGQWDVNGSLALNVDVDAELMLETVGRMLARKSFVWRCMYDSRTGHVCVCVEWIQVIWAESLCQQQHNATWLWVHEMTLHSQFER